MTRSGPAPRPIRGDRTPRLARLAGAAGILAWLAGCASGPATPPPQEPAPSAPPPRAQPASDPWSAPLEAFAQRQAELAQAAARRGHWADAIAGWEVLQALEPDRAEWPQRIAQGQRSARELAEQRWQAARQAQQRGETDQAVRAYAEVLALTPDRTEAADALRQLERDRVRRQHLGQLSRNTMARQLGPALVAMTAMTRAAQAPAAAATAPTAGSPGAPAAPAATPEADGDRNVMEHASLLAGQGEWSAALATLRPLALGRRPDPQARALWVDIHLRQADALVQQGDRPGAIAALERLLQVEPQHPRATARLRELQSARAPR